MGVKRSYQSILDHPKIKMDPKEYRRIQDSLARYKQGSDSERFKNSNGNYRTRNKKQLNMLKKVSAEYVKVMFNEQVEIVVGEYKKDSNQLVDKTNNEFIKSIFKHNDFKKNLGKYLEPAMALGGLVVRPYFNDRSGQIEFSWALADAFFPLESNTNKISECAIPFRTTVAEKDKIRYYTLLEFHEWVLIEEKGKPDRYEYAVKNELYESEKVNELGIQVSLNTLDQYKDLDPVNWGESIERPLFTYFKPAGFNNLAPQSPLGLGICDNCKDTLDAINLAENEFDLEIRRGRRRIAVTDRFLKTRFDQEDSVQYFDEEEDLYQLLPGEDVEKTMIKDLTTDIRTKQYIETINHHLRTLEMETGLSNGTFTFDGGSIRSGNKTATEVVSENSQTYQSRNLHIKELETFIKDVIISVFELAATLDDEKGEPLFSGEIPTHEQIGVNFDDGVFINKEAEAVHYRGLYSEGLIPGWMATQKIMGVPEDKAKELYIEAQLGVVDRTTKDMSDTGFDEFEE
ncbi:phage portal protein [Enterococcus sp. DIV1304_2]|uniref:phage portal protein n=1 Tax=unclassified Enterococcus TaxID=2608891 RepID=UPI003D2FB24C